MNGPKLQVRDADLADAVVRLRRKSQLIAHVADRLAKGPGFRDKPKSKLGVLRTALQFANPNQEVVDETSALGKVNIRDNEPASVLHGLFGGSPQ